MLGLTYTLDNSLRHFAICVFNRATYSRCRELIQEISNHPNMKITVLLGSGAIQKEFGDAKAYIVKEIEKAEVQEIPVEIKDTTHHGSCVTTAGIIQALSLHFSTNRYDAVFVVADRFETLGAAIAASYLNIPVIHIQGGEVTGNIDEKVRHAVTKLADYHFVATNAAKKYVIEMGEESHRVHVVGCPSLDVIRHAAIRRTRPRKRYILCQFHPHTLEAQHAASQMETVLKALTEFCGRTRHVCFIYWPNPDPGRESVIDVIKKAHKEFPNILIRTENEPPVDFLERLGGASFIIGNSSCGLREASFIGVPSINVGDRQGKRERSWNVVDSKFDHEALLKAMDTQAQVPRYKRSLLYGDGRASEYIVRHLQHFDFTLKDCLTYPTQFKHRELHFGESRFASHNRRAKRATYGQWERLKRRQKKSQEGEASLPEHLPGEP